MSATNENRLKMAEEYFYSWRMVEAYNILRRYFDRLPFRPEPGHAKYIGIFIRVLLELGKNYELSFYVSELEKQYERCKTKEILYQLGMVHLVENRLRTARECFEQIVRDPGARDFHTRAKMCLMACYTKTKPVDVNACRALVDSIGTETDPSMRILVDIWRANVLRHEKKLDEAEALLTGLCERVSLERNWYEFFYVKQIQGWLYLDKEDYAKVREVIAVIERFVDSRRSKTVQASLKQLQDALSDKCSFQTIEFGNDEIRSGYVVRYQDKTVFVQKTKPIERLIICLLRKRFIEKEEIVSTLYNREYVPKIDDKLIYSHIHALRKKFGMLGLPASAICSESNGYRLLPTVKRIRGIT